MSDMGCVCGWLMLLMVGFSVLNGCAVFALKHALALAHASRGGKCRLCGKVPDRGHAEGTEEANTWSCTELFPSACRAPGTESLSRSGSLAGRVAHELLLGCAGHPRRGGSRKTDMAGCSEGGGFLPLPISSEAGYDRGVNDDRKAVNMPHEGLTTFEEHSFSEIAKLIEAARKNAFRAVNTALIDLYWQIGQTLSRRIVSAEWGRWGRGSSLGVSSTHAAGIARLYARQSLPYASVLRNLPR